MKHVSRYVTTALGAVVLLSACFGVFSLSFAGGGGPEPGAGCEDALGGDFQAVSNALLQGEVILEAVDKDKTIYYGTLVAAQGDCLVIVKRNPANPATVVPGLSSKQFKDLRPQDMEGFCITGIAFEDIGPAGCSYSDTQYAEVIAAKQIRVEKKELYVEITAVPLRQVTVP